MKQNFHFSGEAGIPKYCPVSAVPLFSPRGIPRWYPEKRGKIKQSHCSFAYLVLCPQIARQNSNLLLFSKLVTIKQPKDKGEEAVIHQNSGSWHWLKGCVMPAKRSQDGGVGDLFLHYLTLVQPSWWLWQVSGNNVRGYCSGTKRWRVFGERWLVLFYEEAGPALPTFVPSVEDGTVVMNLVPFTFFKSYIPKAHGPLDSLEWGQ